MFENVEGVDKHPAAEIVLAKTERGGIVGGRGIDIHDERWHRHDLFKTAENRKLAAF